MHFMRTRRWHPRGTALLMVIVILAVLAVVGVGIASRASREGEAASAKRQYDKSVSCADAAREMLMGQFNAYGVSPTMLTLNQTVEDRQLASGHYDQHSVTSGAFDNLAVTSVVATSGAAAVSTFGVTDVSNRIVRAGLGGQLYRMTVVCSARPSTTGGTPRQNEVEFFVRFGL
jgi:hypothetical protein